MNNLRKAFGLTVLALFAILLMSTVFTSCKKEEVKVTNETKVTSFSPNSGSVGTVVVITGSNFSTVISNNTVTFNGTQAAISAATAGQITATVPSGATTGTITVTVMGNGSATSSSNFTVTP